MTIHTRTLLAAALTVAGGTALGATPSVAAGGLAATTVTIEAEGTDLSGTIKSAQVVCKDERTVILFKQVGTKGGGDDRRIATDTSELSGNVGVWSTGNTGMKGRFYAKVKKTEFCKGDTSPTVKAAPQD